MLPLRFLPVLFCVLPLFVACLKDEPAGIEADIVSVHLEPTAAARLLGITAAPVRQVSANDTDIVFTLAADADTALLRTLSPTFTLSNGATLRCLDGEQPDFRQRRRVAYEVTSQDRQWKRRYTMSFVPAADFPEFFGFEDHALNSPDPHYFTWFEKNADGTARNFWASGNPGFLLSRYDAKSDEYPTSVEAKGRTGTALSRLRQTHCRRQSLRRHLRSRQRPLQSARRHPFRGAGQPHSHALCGVLQVATRRSLYRRQTAGRTRPRC